MYDGNTQVRLPKDNVDLIEFSEKRLKEFKSFNAELRNNKYIMVNKEEQEFKDYLREIEIMTNNLNTNLLEKHIEIEKILMQIQLIPSMPKRPNYINIIQLEKGRVLYNKELEFLEDITPFINVDIFKSQKHYNMFIRRALHIYNYKVDKEAITKVKEFKGTNWEYTYLNHIDTDIFL